MSYDGKMHRRRVLAATSEVIGVGGSKWYVKRATAEEETATGASTKTVERTPTAGERTRAASPSVGGSLNGRPHRLSDDLALVEKSNTEWMHAFLDVREKYEQDVSPRADPNVSTLRRLKREMGTKLIVSLQWDFVGIFGEKEPKRVPPSGSEREATLFEYATELLTAIDHPVDIVVLGNEPIWQTLNEDVIGKNASLLPFTRRLKDHLVQNITAGDPRFLVGAFNRLYDVSVWSKFGGFYRRLFELARNDDDIEGVDLHIHYDAMAEAQTMLTVARKAVPDGLITTTEFSPIWRYNRNKGKRIASFAGGERFADRYGYPEDMTVLEYFRTAQRNPRPRGEMATFMQAMPWYNVSFVKDMYKLLDGYDVEVGTFGFLQDAGFRHLDLTADWRPFQINYLFQRGLIATSDGAHPHYLDDYRKRV